MKQTKSKLRHGAAVVRGEAAVRQRNATRKYLGRLLVYLCLAAPLCDMVGALAQRGGTRIGRRVDDRYERLRQQQRLRARVNPRTGQIPADGYEAAVRRKLTLPVWRPSAAPAAPVVGPGNNQNIKLNRTLGSAGAAANHSRPFKPALGLNTNSWTNIGPRPIRSGGQSWSGRVNDVAVDPDNPRNLYIATGRGGVWYSNDAGNTWTSLTDFLLAASAVNRGSITASAVAVDPNTIPGQHIVYVGTGDHDDPFAGIGLYRMQVNPSSRTVSNVIQITTAAGISLLGTTVSRLRIDPLNMNTLYLCGNMYQPGTDTGGLLVSTNATTGNPPTFNAFTFPPGVSAFFSGLNVVRDIALDPLSANTNGTNLTVGYVARDFDRVYRIAPKNPDPENLFGFDESCSPTYAGLPTAKTLNRVRWDIAADNTGDGGIILGCNFAPNLNSPTGATTVNLCFWNQDASNRNNDGSFRPQSIRGGNGGMDGDVIGTGVDMTASTEGFGTALATDGFLKNAPGVTVVGRIQLAATRLRTGVQPFDQTVVYAAVTNAVNRQVDILRYVQNSQFATGIFRTCTGTPPVIAAPPAVWTSVQANASGQGEYDTAIAASPTNVNVAYFGGVTPMLKTINGTAFASFDPNGTLHADTHAITIHPRNENLVYTGNDGGVFFTRQANFQTSTTANWQSLNDGLATALVLYVTPHPYDPNIVLCGTQDKGVAISRGLSNSSAWDESDGGDGGQIVIDNRSGRTNTMIHVMPFVSFPQNVRRSTDGGASWTGIMTGINSSDRQQLYPPVAMDEKNPDNIYFGTFRVYQSTSQGNSWSAVTPDISFDQTLGSIRRLAVAPRSSDGFTGLNSSDFVYAGTDDGALWMTDAAVTNNTKPWVRLDTAGIGDAWPGGSVSCVTVDSVTPRTAYVTFSNFGVTKVFMVQNAGLSSQVNTALSSNASFPDIPANAITVIPQNPNPPQLVVGTDIGVFFATSPTAGVAWNRMDAGDSRNPDFNGLPTGQSMPSAEVQDVIYNPNTQVLYAATYGRSVWAINLPSSTLTPATGSARNFLVTNTNDSGAGSLRQALLDANTNGATSAASGTIAFEIPGAGVKVISPTSSLPIITVPAITVDGFTQQNFVGSAVTTPIVRIDGTSAGATTDGLHFSAANAYARGISLTRFGGAAIRFTGVSQGKIQACYLGVNTDGLTALANGTGIQMENGSTGCIIGGGVRITQATASTVVTPVGVTETSTHLERNIIAGNTTDGIQLLGTNTTNNLIQNNFIGMAADGLTPVGNGRNGIRVQAPSNGNIIGGTTLFGVAPQLGEYTGAGTNLISGNGSDGILITGIGADNNTVSYNLIGTDVTGSAGAVTPSPLRNRRDGIRIEKGSRGNTIGDTVARNLSLDSGRLHVGATTLAQTGPSVTGNIICGSIDAFTDTTNPQLSDTSAGIRILDPGSESNQIRGNVIGLDINGNRTNGSGNFYGVKVQAGPRNNTIGVAGAAGSLNVISGNVSHGVHIDGLGTNNTRFVTIAGNRIGTDATGLLARPNAGDGVRVDNGSELVTVGGATAADRNLVSANLQNGIRVRGAVTDFNTVQGNFVGVDINGAATSNLGNAMDGILLEGGANNNAVVGNVCSGNLGNGVHLAGQAGTNTTANLIQANLVGLANDGVTPAPNGTTAAPRDGLLIDLGAQSNTIGGSAAAANTVSGNSANGIRIRGTLGASPNTTSNVINNNRVGINVAGIAAVPNQQAGVRIDESASSNTLSVNTISGNTLDGVQLVAPAVNTPAFPATASNTLTGNFIGTRTGAPVGFSIPNSRDGVRVDGTGGSGAENGVSQNLIGTANIVSGNVANGITVTGPRARNNIINNNSIGLDGNANQIITNGGNGVTIQAGANANTLGDITGNLSNIIAGNTGLGVLITGAGTDNNRLVANLIGVDLTFVNTRGNRDIGLVISAGARNNTIGGPVNFSFIGGLGNVISSNNFMGARITGAGTTGNLFLANIIGLDGIGTISVPNSASGPGLVIDSGAAQNTIGSLNANEANIISGNTSSGIDLGGVTVQTTLVPPPTAASNNVILGNLIGLSANGNAAIGNTGDGILIGNGSSNNTIGGTVTNARNAIGSNNGNGIRITGTGTNANRVQGNLIGLDAAATPNQRPNGTTGAPRSGVLIEQGAQNNTIGAGPNDAASGSPAAFASLNTIQFNTLDGVRVQDTNTVGNTIRGNSIQANTGLGINLIGGAEDPFGVTTNDTNDSDDGPNRLLNSPRITGASNNGTNTVVLGEVSSTTAGNATGPVNLDFYGVAAGAGDGSGSGEGTTYIGTLTQVNLGAIPVNFTATLPAQAVSSVVTAVVTDAAGNSSEFSNTCLVVSATGPVVKVTTTVDNGNDTTPTDGSLRKAIIFANSNPGTTIVFQIPRLAQNIQDGNGAFLIRPGITTPTPLPAISADGTIMDGSLETTFLGANPNTAGGPPIVISGQDFVTAQSGLTIQAQNCRIRSLILNNWGSGGNGILLNGTAAIGNQIAGCWLGLNSSGAAAAANGVGVRILSGSANTIGGTPAAGGGNFISGNSIFGVQISGASNNVVVANNLGTNAAGTAAVANATGVELDGNAQLNVIGDNVGSGTLNVISGNTNNGVLLTGANVRQNIVAGNVIGVSRAGATRIANDIGVRLDSGAVANTIGVAGGRNTISGNTTAGVVIDAAGTLLNPNLVQGNFIGTTSAGDTALGGQLDGVLLRNGAQGNTVGGANPTDTNVISGNTGQGVHIVGASPTNTISNLVAGNLIGLATGGAATVSNGLNGIRLDSGAQSNTLGLNVVTTTTTGAGNIVSGNGSGAPSPDGNGIRVTGSGTTGNLIRGNIVGLNQAGTARLGNAQNGILLDTSANANTIGGNTDTTSGGSALVRNVVSGNSANGIVLRAVGSLTEPVLVQGNFIGTNTTGNASLGNISQGVVLESSAVGNQLGTDGTTTASGTSIGRRNVISGNSGHGVVVTGVGTLSNIISGNFVGTDLTGSSAVPNSVSGLSIDNDNLLTPNQIGGSPATPGAAPGNLISGNTQNGVLITGASARGITVRGNLIGLNAAGTAALANGQDGVRVDSAATTNTIGSTTSTDINVISGNTANGIHIVGQSTGATTTANVVLGNTIGLNVARSAVIANQGSGVRMDNGTQSNIVGGTEDGSLNRISGNAVAGVYIAGTAAGNNTNSNLILGNTIGGTGTTGTGFPNGQGVQIDGGAQSNTVGGNVAGNAGIAPGNLIAGNSQNGLLLRGSGTSNNLIAGNVIGRQATSDASALANGINGVLIDSSAAGNIVGGAAVTLGQGASNLISGNGQNGVRISGGSTNVVAGNIIGANQATTGAAAAAVGTVAVPNFQNGVRIDTGASANTIGGSSQPNLRNLIAGNSSNGVLIDASTANVLKANTIGIKATTTATITDVANALANGGIGVSITNSSTNNVIGAATGASPVVSDTNLIAFNGSDGVQISDGTSGTGTSTGNVVRANSIFSNINLGLNLSVSTDPTSRVTANDAGDADTGPNRLQNWPQLTGASVVSGTLTVNGSLDSTTTNSVYPVTVDFYVSSAGDPAGNGEGQTYLGSVTSGAFQPTADQPGVFTFTQAGTSVTAGQVITAVVVAANGNTSEFSNICVTLSAANVIKVTNTNDSGVGSLRQAMTDANALVAAGGVAIAFQIPTTDANFTTVIPNVFVITPLTALPTITRNDITIDGAAETVFLGVNPNPTGGPPIVVRGTSAPAGSDGLKLAAGVSGARISGLNLIGFSSGDAIELGGSGATISGCWIGVSAAGAAGSVNANLIGVNVLAGADNCTIGGLTATSGATPGNVISNNSQHGIQVVANGTQIWGNNIGVNAAGAAFLSNGLNGVLINGGQSNVIGQSGVTGSGNTIAGNGTQAGATNDGNGVRITGATATGNLVGGNRIGANTAGNGALSNSQNGVRIDTGANANTIGATSAVVGAQNVIGGNVLAGVLINDANGNTVAGNLIGAQASGSLTLPNGTNGVQVDGGSQNNMVGGVATSAGTAPGNVISGNTQNGVLVSGTSTGTVTSPNFVQGNLIGTSSAGTAALPNAQSGVRIDTAAQGNLIGVGGAAPSASQRNVISGNTQNGVLITGTNTNLNSVFGNVIGANAAGTAGVTNAQNGVLISIAASNNTVGDLAANQGNTIAFNTRDGMALDAAGGSNPTGNYARGNSIHSNGRLGFNLVASGENSTNGVVTANDAGDGDQGPNKLQNFPTLTSAVLSGTTLTVAGALDSTGGGGNNATYPVSIDLYASAAGDGSGNGEGQTYLGSTATALAAPGSFNFAQGGSLVTATQFITAVATDASGNTSEFSNLCPVVSTANQVLTVSTTADAGLGSLRLAMQKANGIPGADPVTIQFNIPNTDTGFSDSVFQIKPTTALPVVTRASVIIDGSTETTFLGSNPNSTGGPPILISGQNLTAGTVDGIVFQGAGSELRSVIINRFSGNGVLIQANSCRVTNCYLGTDRQGNSAAANGTGVSLSNAASCTIGSATAGAGNLISGNTTQGVLVTGGGGNRLLGNVIGVTRLGASGDPLANGQFGVLIRSTSINNQIGGTAAGESNLIAFNPRGGVIVGSNASDACTGNQILRNAIFKNSASGGLGIDLGNDGVTQNDIGDGDTGPNRLQNFPLITTVSQSGSQLTVTGLISKPSPANTQVVLEPLTIDLFGNFTDNPSGFGEGGTYLGSVAPDAAGNWTTIVTIPGTAVFFSRALTGGEGPAKASDEGAAKLAPLPAGALTFVTAMATDTSGNSSEFSKPKTIGGAVFTATYPAGLNMWSLPRNLSQFSTNDLANLFQLPASSLRLALWDAPTQGYFLFGSPGFSTLNNLGRGYWVNLPQPVSIAFTGQPFTQPFRWTLSQGWNLMGNMGDTDMRYLASQISVIRNGSDTGTIDRVFQSNPTAPVVDPYVWSFDNPTNSYQLVHDAAANLVNVSGFVPAVTVRDRVPKGQACWVFCRENNLALQFGATMFTQPVLRNEAVLRSARLATPGMDLTHWAVQLAAQAGEAKDGAAVFGVNATQSGVAGFLAQKPPVPAIRSQFVRVTFDRDQTGELGYDIRSSMNGNTHWNVTVAGNQPNEEVWLSWPKLSTLPRDLRFTLVDAATGQRQFMNTTSAYRFRASTTATARRFRIEVSADPAGRLAMSGAEAQVLRSATNAAITLRYSLTRDARVTVRLINLAGKVFNQTTQTARLGLNSLTLDGKDALGRVLPRGLYMLDVVARADDGEEVRAVRSAVLK